MKIYKKNTILIKIKNSLVRQCSHTNAYEEISLFYKEQPNTDYWVGDPM